MRFCSHLPTQNLSFVQQTFPAVPPGTRGQVPLIKLVLGDSAMRSEISGARENRGAGAAFQDTKPGADFQTGQVWGRFPPHTTPRRPLWPLLAERPQKSHLASLSRACIPLSPETAFSHSPGPGAEGGSGSRVQGRGGEAGHLEGDGLSPSSVPMHSGCCLGQKVKRSDKVTGCTLL